MPEQPQPRPSRRRFLTLGGAVVGAAWVTPQVLSIPAAAAATCMDGTLQWAVDPGSGAVPSGTVSPLSGSTGTMTLAWTDPTSAVSTSTVDGIFPRGMSAVDTYHMQLGSSGSGPVTLDLEFDSSVTDVRFSVLDVDRSAGTAWRDEIEVQAQLGTDPFFDGVGSPGANVDTVVTNRTYRGRTSTSNDETLADVGFVFDGPIDRVRIIYRRAAGTSSQGIGLGNVEACV